jgi:hypothetical protein
MSHDSGRSVRTSPEGHERPTWCTVGGNAASKSSALPASTAAPRASPQGPGRTVSGTMPPITVTGPGRTSMREVNAMRPSSGGTGASRSACRTQSPAESAPDVVDSAARSSPPGPATSRAS